MPLDRPGEALTGTCETFVGEGPSPEYEALVRQFRPIFSRIRLSSVEREIDRRLPFDEILALRRAGFLALRVPRDHGGSGASLPDLFALLIELSRAESNLTQALRAHFGFVEHILYGASADRQRIWFRRLAEGDLVGAAWSEVGENARLSGFSTKLDRSPDGWRLNGAKFYTTGSLFADWIHVGATDAAGEPASATIRRDAIGVEVLDDWDGMGQRLTASGTARFDGVLVEDAEVTFGLAPFPFSQAFYQLVHLATLAGIGWAAAEDLAAAVASRQRTYSHAAASRPAADPQVLQVVGRARSAAYGASAIVLQAARALQRAAEAVGRGEEEQAANAAAEIEIWQAQSVVSDLILGATGSLFDALGASATLRSKGLDRYWRNARTIVSHNPRMYRERILGDYAVNGTIPPAQWRIGTPDDRAIDSPPGIAPGTNE